MSTSLSNNTSNYHPRNETEKFRQKVDFVLKFPGTKRFTFALSGIAACETANLYRDNFFFVYDLSQCTNENLDKTCEINFLNKAVIEAYKKFGSPKRNIAVFYNASSLKECDDIANFNKLWSLVDGSKFPNINVLILFEENFPRETFSEKVNISGYITAQRSRCRDVFFERDFNAQAFTSRFNHSFQVEQAPTNPTCTIELPEMSPNKEETKLDISKIILILLIIVILVLLISLFGYLIFKKQRKKK